MLSLSELGRLLGLDVLRAGRDEDFGGFDEDGRDAGFGFDAGGEDRRGGGEEELDDGFDVFVAGRFAGLLGWLRG